MRRRKNTVKNSSYDARLAEIREARLTEEVQNLRRTAESLEATIIKAYSELFPEYAYPGEMSAVYLLAAEVKALRQLAEQQAARADVARERVEQLERDARVYGNMEACNALVCWECRKVSVRSDNPFSRKCECGSTGYVLPFLLRQGAEQEVPS